MLIPTGLIAHKTRVLSLYKKALRNLEAFYDRREVYRYHAIKMRARFEDNKDIHDPCVSKELIQKGEQEFFQNLHWHQRKYPESPGGVAYQRETIPPDWVLDYWHPLEKARYPDYFARREKRKGEFVDKWLDIKKRL